MANGPGSGESTLISALRPDRGSTAARGSIPAKDVGCIRR